MPFGRRRSPAALAAVAMLALAGCATRGAGPGASAAPPEEVYRELLGRNPGLGSLRAVVEARISFAGGEVSLPGVLLLDGFAGFRLELLDPLDRPLSVIFVSEGRIVQYRPAQRLAASLAVFPAECRGIGVADWVGPVLGASLGPSAAERLADHAVWGGGRALERERGGERYQTVGYRDEGGRRLPRQVVWHCGDLPVLRLRLRDWAAGEGWRLPRLLEIEYPAAVLSVRVELKEIETNPAPTGQPFIPRLGPDVRWSTWNLPG